MTIEEISHVCNRLKGVTSDIKWEDHLCFNVGEKIFLITSPDHVPPGASFKVTGEEFSKLTEKDGVSQARYLAKGQWVSVDNINRLTLLEWEFYIAESHRLVASKLTKKLRKELGID